MRAAPRGLVAACALLACVAGLPARAAGEGLAARGVELGLTYTGEVMADVAGGMRRGAAYEGRAELDVHADLAKLLDWRGTTLHASAYQIHGYGPSAHYVGNFMDVSNIEAHPTTRLYALWIQKEFLGGRASLRAGQLGADEEFLLSDTASPLMNGTFGWAALVANDQTSGGPAYPLATPGVRLRVAPRRNVAFLLAAFAGNPAGGGCNQDPQLCDRYGTTFSTSGGTLWMSELQYRTGQGEGASALPGTYKLGGWYQNGSFPDEHFGRLASGATVSLASPLAVGPLEHRGDWGLYAIADQALWRGAGGARRLDAFLRVGAAPADRNLVSTYVDAGLGYTGLFAGRPRDTLTLGVARANISGDAAALDRDRRLLGAPGYPVRDYESVIELTYVAHLARGWTVQPDLQVAIHPGGNVPDPADPSHAIRNALVLGVRTTVRF